MTVISAAALVADRPSVLAAKQAVGAPPWQSRIGLELYTVRDLLATDNEGTLAKVADIGYTEVDPTSYNNMSPKDLRAMLDRLKLTMPSTHAPARGSARIEWQLEGFQVMGIEYTEIAGGGARGRMRRLRILAGRRHSAGRVFRRWHRMRAKRVHGNRGFGPYQTPGSLESVQRRAGQRNADGRIAQKFGMKLWCTTTRSSSSR